MNFLISSFPVVFSLPKSVDGCFATLSTRSAVISSTINPVTDEPITDEPITDEPITEEPITDEPITDEPITDAPITDSPIANPPILRACSPSDVSYGMGNNLQPQTKVDVNYLNFESTQIGTTLDTFSTMQITCMAIQGYYVYMSLSDGFNPPENAVFPPPRRVTINAACSSLDMEWNYVLTCGGMNYAIPSATCDQIPCLGAC